MSFTTKAGDGPTAAAVEGEAQQLIDQAKEEAGHGASPLQVWSTLHQKLLKPTTPFPVHQLCYQKTYGSSKNNESDDDCSIKPSWIPTPESMAKTNVHKIMTKLGFDSYEKFYAWSIHPDTREDFWKESVEQLGIVWDQPPSRVFDLTKGPAHVSYFPDGRLNITDSCFQRNTTSGNDNNNDDNNAAALVYAMESHPRAIQTMSFAVLERLANQIANGIQNDMGLQPGDAIAICMPMTPESIAIYLGIVKAGCVVVSIADSFSASEIATRCRLGQAKAIFCQDVIYRDSRFLPLFARVLEADDILQKEMDDDDNKETKSSEDMTSSSMKVVVVPGMLHAVPYNNNNTLDSNTINPKTLDFSESGRWDDKDENGNPVPLHESVLPMMRVGLDCSWHDLLRDCSDEFTSVKRNSMDACNILFSSGTTGEPKAIPWSHSTPIKCAVDGFYHQDIHMGDRVAWPTNIGWMMGPWLLFQLINGATIGIFNGVTSTDAFCQFVDEAKISMVGVIPSLAKAWQAHDASKDCDWSSVRCFSSTGEASDPANYLWLASRVPGYAPVIEYCGGTEIGGSYLSSTMVQPNAPSMFSTPVLGSQFYLLNKESQAIEDSGYVSGESASISGEVALVPPSIGLSTHLLNRDHFDTYYKGMPSGCHGEVLRRHGDEIELVRSTQHNRTLGSSDNATPYFRALGRSDDTMNLGGIKVGSVEIERVCNLVAEIKETAAIAVSAPNRGGPSKLVVYVVLEEESADPKGIDTTALKVSMQKMIKAKLNPLFGITDVVITESLPRTASNKVMRRLLRDEYLKLMASSRL